MSMEHEELVKCSQCGHEDGFVISWILGTRDENIHYSIIEKR